MAGKFIIETVILNVLCCMSSVYSDPYCSSLKGGNEVILQCSETIGGMTARLVAIIKLCRKRPVVSIEIDAPGIHVKEEYDTSVSIPIMGLGTVVMSITSTVVGVKGVVDFNLKYVPFKGTSLDIYKDTLRNYDCNAAIYWFNTVGIGGQVGVGVGGVVFLILCIVSCYCCCCRRRKDQASPNVIVMPGHGGYVPPSNVPYFQHKDEGI